MAKKRRYHDEHSDVKIQSRHHYENQHREESAVRKADPFCPCDGGCPRCVEINGEPVNMDSPDKSGHQSGRSAGKGIQERIDSLRQGGKALSEEVKRFFEPRFKAGFDHLRLHEDENASVTAKAIGAKAFVSGKDIFIGFLAPKRRRSSEMRESIWTKKHMLRPVARCRSISFSPL